MTTIKAIETRYAGCRFRSRLEARWAVFFDHMRLDWEYEPQGFELTSGWYLPDFYMPANQLWIEVKGADPSAEDLAKCTEFAAEQYGPGQYPVKSFMLLQGEIPRPPLTGIPYLGYDPLWGYEDPFVAATWTPGVSDPDKWCWAAPNPRLDQALTAARSARFEHGERG